MDLTREGLEEALARTGYIAEEEVVVTLYLALKLEKADIAAYLRERMVPEAKATGTDGPAGVS